MFFADDAEIILTNGSTLNLDHSHLSASCNDMWRPCIMANQFNESILINECSIRDMELGVRANTGATINSKKTIFEDNKIGLVYQMLRTIIILPMANA